MKLTRQQMQSGLREDAEFARWYAEEFMRLHLPQFYFAVSPEGRTEMILNARRYAEQHGFRDIRAQVRFVTLMWQIGPNFFVQPGFREALADRSGTDMERIDRLLDVPRDQAADAILQIDNRYWYPEMVPQQEGGG